VVACALAVGTVEAKSVSIAFNKSRSSHVRCCGHVAVIGFMRKKDIPRSRSVSQPLL
jgi:hypothetical protein